MIGSLRLPFLLLTPVCVGLGWEVADYCCAPGNSLAGWLALVCALAAHVSVNTFNEHADFVSGLDLQTSRTPFSGGSGTLVRHPDRAQHVLRTAQSSLALMCVAGICLVWLRGWMLLPAGLAGILLITLYTGHIVRQPLLCLAAAGAGFGLLMVGGTAIAVGGNLSMEVLWATLPTFFVVNNLLLLNQFPDIDADRSVGRITLPIAAGLRRAALVYGLFAALAAWTLVAGVALGHMPGPVLIGLLPLAAALPVTYGAWMRGNDVPRLLPFMAINVGISVLTPALMAVGYRVA